MNLQSAFAISALTFSLAAFAQENASEPVAPARPVPSGSQNTRPAQPTPLPGATSGTAGGYGAGAGRHGGGGGGYGTTGGRSVSLSDVATLGSLLQQRGTVPPLIVRFSPSDPAQNDALQEDLNVMTRLLEKSLERPSGDDSRDVRMGIELRYSGGARSVRALYLEDFGALFMIKVNFPLFAPAAPGPQKAPTSTDSDWERARREVYGPPGGQERTPIESTFDPQQVEAFKTILLKTLKNAANIRHLKPDDYVTLAVFGRPDASSKSSRGKSSSSTGMQSDKLKQLESQVADLAKREQQAAAGQVEKARREMEALRREMETVRRQFEQEQRDLEKTRRALEYKWYESDSGATSGTGTILTLRAKRADINAFAAGNLDFDAFRKKVQQQAYPGSGYDLTSINSWTREKNW